MTETARLMSGTELADTILRHTATRAMEFAEQYGYQPCLATVLVGDDPASATYVRMKQNQIGRAHV